MVSEPGRNTINARPTAWGKDGDVRSARGRYAWITVPASFYFELHGDPAVYDLDRFDFRVGGRLVDTTHAGEILLDIETYEDATGNVIPFTPRPGVTPVPAEKIKRIDLVARLSEGDPSAPFLFHLGDDVVVIPDDRNQNPESRGVIIEGACEYQLGSGSRGYAEPLYDVQRADGTTVRAGEMALAKREPHFANLREATRIIRNWIRSAHARSGS